jgi:hypothetical protein
MNRKLATTSILGIGGFIILLSLFFLNAKQIETINPTHAKENVLNDIQKIKEQEDKAYSWINTKKVETGYLDGQNKDVIQRYREKKGVIEFLFASIVLNDPNLFVQSFQPEVISKDLFKVENTDKVEVAKNLMKKISRNGKLIKVGYENKLGVFNMETQEANIILVYEDGVQVKIPIQFQLSETHHHKDDQIYSIKTSVWEIIDRIEKSTS